MESIKYFDPVKKQLIYLSKKPSPDFWDAHWNVDEMTRDKILGVKNTLVSKITKKYLDPSDGIILEGGCGWGQYVASLLYNGYRTIGIDFANKTVRTINQFVPELHIILGDIKKLPFHDNYFSGYWSLGVIEHFLEGYEDVALEMFRVIKDSGYLFITFPYMSPLRRIKGELGCYESWQDSLRENFHQFTLNPKLVIQDFEKKGFRLLKAIPHDVVTGIQHEISFLRPLVQKLRDYVPHNRFAGCIEIIFDKLMSPFFSHCILLVFRKCADA